MTGEGVSAIYYSTSRYVLTLHHYSIKPWNIQYHRAEEATKLIDVTIRSANGVLNVSQEGLYELLSVRDANCPGEIVPKEDAYEVDWIPRPSVVFVEDGTSNFARNGSLVRQPVCEGTEDWADIKLTGNSYRVETILLVHCNDRLFRNS